jgi:hypothetical protein
MMAAANSEISGIIFSLPTCRLLGLDGATSK